MPQMSEAEESGIAAADQATDPQRVATMRGAGVQVDAERVGHIAAVLGLVAVMVVSGVLLVAGIRKNAQIDNLRSADVVQVDLTVSRCLALIGGTGQSPAGYECQGTYAYQGHTYTEGVPGSANLPVGSTVHGIIASGDPGLFSTSQTVASEHAAPARVAVPAVVLGAAGAVLVWVALRRRRRSTDA